MNDTIEREKELKLSVSEIKKYIDVLLSVY